MIAVGTVIRKRDHNRIDLKLAGLRGFKRVNLLHDFSIATRFRQRLAKVANCKAADRIVAALRTIYDPPSPLET